MRLIASSWRPVSREEPPGKHSDKCPLSWGIRLSNRWEWAGLMCSLCSILIWVTTNCFFYPLQVRFRFQDLMKLFHSASQKSTSCSSKSPVTSRRIAAPDWTNSRKRWLVTKWTSASVEPQLGRFSFGFCRCKHRQWDEVWMMVPTKKLTQIECIHRSEFIGYSCFTSFTADPENFLSKSISSSEDMSQITPVHKLIYCNNRKKKQ